MLQSHDIQCPHCWETIEILVDISAGAQQYIEDCSVCCRPIALHIRVDESGMAEVSAFAEEA